MDRSNAARAVPATKVLTLPWHCQVEKLLKVAGAKGASEEGWEVWAGGGGSLSFRKSQKPEAGLRLKVVWK